MQLVLPDFSNPTIAAFYAVYYSLVVLAALLGGAPERLAALVFALVIPAQSVLYTISGAQQFVSVDLGLLVIDAAAVACLLLIAYNADRYWPPLATGMLILSVLSHLARAIYPPFQELSYAQFNALPTILALVFVTTGASVYRLRRFRGFQDRPWVPYAEQARIREVLGI